MTGTKKQNGTYRDEGVGVMQCPCELEGITCDGEVCEIELAVQKMDFRKRKLNKNYESRKLRRIKWFKP